MGAKLLGIDIRTSGVAVVVASGGVKGIQIQEARYVPATPETDLAAALSQAVEGLSGAGTVAMASIPLEAVSFRHLSIPFSSPKKIRMVLPSEMEPMLPFPLDSVALDFILVSKGVSGANTQIIAAALQKSVLDGYLELLAGCGISPDTIVPGGWVAGHVLAGASQELGTWMFIDFTGRQGCVVCGTGGRPVGIRGFRISESIKDVSSQIFSEAQRTLLGFSERLAIPLMPEIIWTAGADVDRIKPGSSPFEAPVELLNLAHDLKTGVRIAPEVGWDPATMNGALALVLSRLRGGAGLRFYEKGIGIGAFFSEYARELWKLGAVAAVTAILGFFNLWYDSYALQNKTTQIESQIKGIFSETFPDVKKIVDPLQQMKVKIREIQEASGLEAEGTADIRMIDVMETLSQNIPNSIDVEMTQLNFSGNTLLLAGDTGNFNSVDELKTNLEKNKAFSAVTITSANMEKSGDKVQFKLKADLAPG
jgi:general secretion pathway protein L